MENLDNDEIIPGMSSDNAAEKKKPSVEKRLAAAKQHEESDESDSDSDSDSSDSDSDHVCTVCKMTFSGYIPLKQHEKGSKHKKALRRAKKALKDPSDDEDEEEGKEGLIQEPFATCEPCSKEFSGPENYRLHLKSKLHKQKVLHATILQQVKENGEINVEKLKKLYNKKFVGGKMARGDGAEDAPDASTPDLEEGFDEPDKDEFECKVCEKAFTGLTPYVQHVTSKTHERQVQKEKLLRQILPDNDAKVSEVSDVSSLTVEDDIIVCLACSTSFSGPESAMLHLKSRGHAKSFEKYLKKLEKKKKKKALESKEAESESYENKADEILENLSHKEEAASDTTDKPENLEHTASEENSDSDEITSDEKYASYKRAMKSLREDF